MNRRDQSLQGLCVEPHRTQPVGEYEFRNLYFTYWLRPQDPARARVGMHAVHRSSYLHNTFTDSHASTVGANLVWHAGPPTAHRFLDTPVTHAPSPITVGGRCLWPQGQRIHVPMGGWEPVQQVARITGCGVSTPVRRLLRGPPLFM